MGEYLKKEKRCTYQAKETDIASEEETYPQQ